METQHTLTGEQMKSLAKGIHLSEVQLKILGQFYINTKPLNRKDICKLVKCHINYVDATISYLIDGMLVERIYSYKGYHNCSKYYRITELGIEIFEQKQELSTRKIMQAKHLNSSNESILYDHQDDSHNQSNQGDSCYVA